MVPTNNVQLTTTNSTLLFLLLIRKGLYYVEAAILPLCFHGRWLNIELTTLNPAASVVSSKGSKIKIRIKSKIKRREGCC